jgi:thiol-disulfide isomerase/thioredoxin
MNIARARIWISALLLAAICTGAHAGERNQPQPFVRGSLQKIVDSNSNSPLIVNFWSIDCAYCQQELALLSKLARTHPRWSIVLVSADAPEQADAASSLLRKHGFDPASTWIFADDYVERLRFDVDRRWHGELPRTYLYVAGKPVYAVSGKLSAERIEQRFLSGGVAR